jgi:hypothetical protein
MLNSTKNIETLIAENKKLKAALSRLIPWAGVSADSPDWATPEAKLRNRQMCEEAIENASNCFPENYNGFTDEEHDQAAASSPIN